MGPWPERELALLFHQTENKSKPCATHEQLLTSRGQTAVWGNESQSSLLMQKIRLEEHKSEGRDSALNATRGAMALWKSWISCCLLVHVVICWFVKEEMKENKENRHVGKGNRAKTCQVGHVLTQSRFPGSDPSPSVFFSTWRVRGQPRFCGPRPHWAGIQDGQDERALSSLLHLFIQCPFSSTACSSEDFKRSLQGVAMQITNTRGYQSIFLIKGDKHWFELQMCSNGNMFFLLSGKYSEAAQWP